jgi:hypothetical protein
VKVEVESGENQPYKNTHFLRELLLLRSLSRPPAKDGSLGNIFVVGVHIVLVGPTRGQL